MRIAPKPANELERLEALKKYQILDTDPELSFDKLVELAAEITETPFAIITFVDEVRQWFKAKIGLDINETSRDISFCSHAILEDDLMVVENTHEDPRFTDNPLVTEDPQVKFYAGMPLQTRDGHNLGTLCVLDSKERSLDDFQKLSLKILAEQVVKQLELRKTVQDLNLALEEKNRYYDELLKEKEKALLEAKKKGEFLAQMSHEIRVPLHGIIGITQILAETALDPVQQDHLHTLRQTEEHLLNIVNEVLDLSKLESNKVDIVPIPTYMEEMLKDIEKLHRPRVEAKGLAFYLEIPNALPDMVLADAFRLRQIVENLITNAIKFTQSGYIELKLQWKQVQKSKKAYEVRIEVTDTGIGIRPENHELIFEEFRQAEVATSRFFGGTGLGISIAKKLTELMGGKIGLLSPVFPKDNKKPGSKFWIKLTLPAIDKSTPMGYLQEEQEQNIREKSFKILVVEDDMVSQMLIKSVLNNLQCRSFIASNAQEAWESLKNESFDLVFMDANLPDENGLELTKKIRSNNVFEGPIISLSANASSFYQEECQKAGMNASIIKPFKKNDVVKILADYLLD